MAKLASWLRAINEGKAPSSLRPWASAVASASRLFFAGRLSNGMDPFDLINAVIWVESRGNPKAQSHKGAVGLMQLMPTTARAMFKDLGYPPDTSRLEPGPNIAAGSRYLARLLHRWDGNVTKAVASYYAGAANVQKHGAQHYANYVDKVITYGRRFASIRTAVDKGIPVVEWSKGGGYRPPKGGGKKSSQPGQPSAPSGGGGFALLAIGALLALGGADA